MLPDPRILDRPIHLDARDYLEPPSRRRVAFRAGVFVCVLAGMLVGFWEVAGG